MQLVLELLSGRASSQAAQDSRSEKKTKKEKKSKGKPIPVR
jgi:hypothetical protein